MIVSASFVVSPRLNAHRNTLNPTSLNAMQNIYQLIPAAYVSRQFFIRPLEHGSNFINLRNNLRARHISRTAFGSGKIARGVKK